MHRHPLAGVLCVFLLFAGLAGAEEPPPRATAVANPLAPPDTSSPRATLRSFLENGDATWRLLLARQDASELGRRAQSCLNLSEVPPSQRRDVSLEATLQLFDVFNRIEVPALEDVPDEEEMERKERTRWVVPNTRIAIARVEKGESAGEWLFTPRTVSRVSSYYRRTRDLPLKTGAVVEDGYQLYITSGGSWVPAWLIAALPAWTQATYGGQTLFQWGLAFALLVLAAALGWGSARWSRRRARQRPMWGLVAPAVWMLLAAGALHVIDQQVNITGPIMGVLRFALEGVFYLAAAWAATLAGGVGADAILRWQRIRARSRPLDVQLIRIGMRAVALLAVFAIVVVWARSIGIPLLGTLAGLGVGGIAVALAAQRTVENFIGGVNLIADRPVDVGDFCLFGNQMGTVEQIGLRSTRVRTLERSVLTIPNAEFSRLQLDNLSRRDRRLLRTTLNLRLETTTDQLERVLAGVRALLEHHEAVYESPRVRLVAAGPLSLDVEIFAYLRAADQNEFLQLQEGIFFEILRAVEDAGTALAPPAQTTYFRAAERAEPRRERSEAAAASAVQRS